MRTITLSVAAVFLLLSVSASDGAVLCAKPKNDGTFSTGLKIREMCKPAEVQLDPGALGLQGPPGPGGARLVDANGTPLGSFPLLMALPGLPAPLSLSNVVRPEGFLNVGFNVYFENADCTGQPLTFRSTSAVPGFVLTPFGFIGNTAYYTDSAGSLLTVRSGGSRPYTPDQCTDPEDIFIPPDLCCEPFPTPEESGYAPIRSVDIGAFVPPFHLEVD